MFHSWTFAHPQADHSKRATRVLLKSPVRIFMPFESWQLSWNLTSLNLSLTGILCGLNVIDEATAQVAVDLEALLQAEPVIRVQIEHELPHLFAPVVWARIVRSTRQPWGLELAMSFTESSNDLISLVEELLSPTYAIKQPTFESPPPRHRL